MPTCTNCTDWCTVHVLPHNEHVITPAASCANTDPTHVPRLPCKCKRDPITKEWIHVPGCTKHP